MDRSTRAAFFDKHMRSWQSSGMSRMAYCAEHGIDRHALEYYCRKHRAKVSSPDTVAFINPIVKSTSTSGDAVIKASLGNGVVLEFRADLAPSLQQIWLSSLAGLPSC